MELIFLLSAENDRDENILTLHGFGMKYIKRDLRIKLGIPFHFETEEELFLEKFNRYNQEQFVLEWNIEILQYLIFIEKEKNIEANQTSDKALERVLLEESNSYHRAKIRVIRWFCRKGYEDLVKKLLDDTIFQGKKSLIKEQYEEIFLRYWKNNTSDWEKCKKELNDKIRWKNPSAYLKKMRIKYNITVSKMKNHPAFIWVDPKGTAED